MKKFLIIFAIILLVASIFLWKTGIICDGYISISVMRVFENNAGQSAYILFDKEKELKDKLVPTICSENEFTKFFKDSVDRNYKYLERLYNIYNN